jgi:hypothetical protein
MIVACDIIKTVSTMTDSPIIGIEFYNRTATKLLLWIELSCDELELITDTEYRLESPETEYRIEFDKDYVVIYYQYSFGPKILKRPASKEIRNPAPWELVIDNTQYED